MKKDKIGQVIIPGDVFLEVHEENTAKFLALILGWNIKFIKPIDKKGAHTADAIVNGVYWELKSPISSNRRTIEKRFRESARQSEKVVFDLRRVKKYPDKVEKELESLFNRNVKSKIKRMIIIKNDGKILDFIK